jgi:hypothetical protein
MARHRSKRARRLPESVHRLITAARHPLADRDHAANPDALRALGKLAVVTIPTRGVFVAHDSDVCLAIDKIAKAHLGLDEARREYREALKAVPQFGDRDPIETAVNHILSVSDEAYFCAGLILGAALMGR